MIRVPNAFEYMHLPYAERVRAVEELRDLLRRYAATEIEDVMAARQRVLGGQA